MKWTIEYYSQNVQNWAGKMPIGIRAAYAKLTGLLAEFEVDLRPKGKEGIARVFYCTLVGKRIVVLHGFIKKTQETPRKELDIAIRRMKEVKDEQRKK